MSFTTTIILGFLLVIIIMTLISEPKISVQYFKAASVSAGKMIMMVKDFISGFTDGGGKDANGKSV
jgi:hypothetical protein